MAIDGISPTAIILPALNVVYRSGKTAFEVASVGDQTRQLLGTIRQVVSDIERARQLRRQKAKVLDVHEKTKIDETIKSSEAAVMRLQLLVESARVDMMTDWGKISTGTRIMWVLDKSNKVPTMLALLNAHNTTLNTQITIMSLKAGPLFDDLDEESTAGYFPDRLRRKATVTAQVKNARTGGDGSDDDLPPSYRQATVDMLHRRRESRRRPTSLQLQPSVVPESRLPDPPQSMNPQNATTAGNEGPSANLNDFSTFFAQDASMRSPMIGLQLGVSKKSFDTSSELDSALLFSRAAGKDLHADTVLPTHGYQPSPDDPANPFSDMNATETVCFDPIDDCVPSSSQPSLIQSNPQRDHPTVQQDRNPYQPPSMPAVPKPLLPQPTGDVAMRSRANVAGHSGTMMLEWFEPRDFSRVGRPLTHGYGSSSTRDSSRAPLMSSGQRRRAAAPRRGARADTSWLQWRAQQPEKPIEDLYNA